MKYTLIGILLGCLLSGSLAFAVEIHVPGDYSTIQEGIDASISGDTVIVADGTYTGFGNVDLNLGGKAITVRSDNGNSMCIIDCNGYLVANRAFHFYSSETVDSIVEGFTFTNGGDTGSGGVIFCEINSNPHIKNCCFDRNIYGENGSGLFCDNASPRVSQCIFQDNIAENFGGAVMCVNGAEPIFTECTFRRNHADQKGGALYIMDASPTIEFSQITANSAAGQGSIRIAGFSDPIITDCIISNNNEMGVICEGTGTFKISNCTISDHISYGIYSIAGNTEISDCFLTGNSQGIYSASAELTLSGSIISGNASPVDGGGITITNAMSAVITNCLFMNNTAQGDGGGLVCTLSDVTIENCTFSSNTSGMNGGGIWHMDANLTILNCIVWNNHPEEIFTFGGGVLAVTNSDIQQSIGVYPGTDNINEDPLFVNGVYGNYCLSHIAAGQVSDSPCVNAGSVLSSSVCYDTLDGEICLNSLSTRSDNGVDAGTVDMGFHYDPNAPVPVYVPSLSDLGIFLLISTMTLLFLNPFRKSILKIHHDRK